MPVHLQIYFGSIAIISLFPWQDTYLRKFISWLNKGQIKVFIIINKIIGSFENHHVLLGARINNKYLAQMTQFPDKKRKSKKIEERK